jgi:hypothetical protein
MYKDDTATRNPVKDAIDILPENIRESISRINEVINYEPVIGIMGKQGQVNPAYVMQSLICAVSDVECNETAGNTHPVWKRSVN